MRFNRDIGGRVGDARENEALAHLVVVEEGLVRIIYSSLNNLASTGAASTCFARVGKVDTGLLSGIENVDIISAFDRLLTVWRNELNIVRGHHLDVSSSARAELTIEVVSLWV